MRASAPIVPLTTITRKEIILMITLTKTSPSFDKRRGRINKLFDGKSAVAQRFPTARERKHEEAAERADTMSRSAALAEWDALIAALKDPKTPPAVIWRLIAVRRVGMVRALLESCSIRRFKELQAERQAVNALAQSWKCACRSQSHQQELEYNGPKIQAGLKYLCGLFLKTLDQAGFDDGTKNSLLLQFKDLVEAEEANLKRAIDEA